MTNTIDHVPVMLQEVLDYTPESIKIFIDGTLGHGGHSKAVLQHFPNLHQLIGIDPDEIMLRKAEQKLSACLDQSGSTWVKLNLLCNSYTNIPQILQSHHISWGDVVFLDLGVNMEHFRDVERWFSIEAESKLDMRFDKNQEFSAYDIINNYPEEKLAQVFIDYADFGPIQAKKIAQTIVQTRRNSPLGTTRQLKDFFHSLGMGIKPCIVLFQALRIETNHEIDNLKLFLAQLDQMLAPWGVCMVMSYHSIEDRLVKQSFKNYVETGAYTLVCKKAIQPNYKEIEKNKAARSAKLRIIKKN